MRTIIVTGGAGFIGSNLVDLLLTKTRGTRIVVFDKLTYAGSKESLKEALSDPRVRFVKGDIASAGDVRGLFRTFRPERVFNLAAESHVDRSIDGPENFIRTNLEGTFRLLEGSRRYLAGSGPSIRKTFRFLHVSTDEVYGSLGPKGKFKETTPYAPNSPYSATKAGADHLVRAYGETFGVPVLTTNCSNNYGPRQFPEKLVPLVLLNAMAGEPLPVYGKGSNVRDWLYVEDHCEGLARVMDRGRPGDKYNLGGDCELTNLQVVFAICGLLEERLPASRNPAFARRGIARYRDLVRFVKDRPGHDLRYAMDFSKARRELGWTPRHDFHGGMRRTVEWYLSHLDWCDRVQAGNYQRQRLGLGKGKA